MSAYFSIVIPAYNRAHVLPRAVDSVIAQRFTDWELLVVDDGSTDNTAEVMKRYAGDPRIKYVYQDNAERSAARNRGISQAQGTYVCFLDSDDTYLDNHLQEIYDELQRNGEPVAMVRTFARIKEGRSTTDQEFIPLGSLHPLQYLHSHTIYPCNVCAHNSILASERFDTRFSLAEDTDLWTRILKMHPLITLERVTTEYYISPENSSSSLNAETHERYIRTLEHIFSDREVKEIVPARLIKTYFWKRYLWMSHDYIKRGKKMEAKTAYGKMLGSYPAKALSPESISTFFRIFRMS